MYKLVALDMDGTLLDQQSKVRPAVREAVREAIERGVLVTLATGRRFDTAAEVAADLGVEAPIVLGGGTLIQDSLTGEVLYEDTLPREALRSVIGEIVRDNQQPVLFTSPRAGGFVYAGPKERDSVAVSDWLDGQQFARRLPYDELPEVEHVIGVGVFQLDDVLRPLYERLRRRPDCNVLLWDPDPLFPYTVYMLDIVSAGCSKAKALAHLADKYGIRMDEVMAVGDQINDVDMLQAVGLGVAMGNAIPSVRELAKAVVGTNEEDGVAEALRRFVLDGQVPEPEASHRPQRILDED